MGNKQSTTDLFKQQKPRNVFSLYGPKPQQQQTSSSSPTTSLQSSVINDSIMCTLESQKEQLRYLRQNRNTRQDGFTLHSNPESLIKAINFITKYVHAETTIEINTSIINESSVQSYVHEFVEQEQEESYNYQKHHSAEKDQGNEEEEDEDLLQYLKEYSKEVGTSTVQIRSFSSKNKETSTKSENDEDHSDGKVRPTAYFGNTGRQTIDDHSVNPLNLERKDTFGELGGGIQITNQQSFEDPDFAAAPCRQTGFFGESKQSLRGFYKQLAQKQFNQDELFSNVQNQEVKEEEDDDEEEEEAEGNKVEIRGGRYAQYINDPYQQQQMNQQANQKEKIKQKDSFDEEDEEEDNEEPILLTIDLSAKKNKEKPQEVPQKVQNEQMQVVNISPNQSKPQKPNTSSSKSPNRPEQQPKAKPHWKPISPRLVSANVTNNNEKNVTKVELPHREKSPIIIQDKNERKKSSSFVVLNRQEKKNREKNKSQDFNNEIKTIDSQIDKLTSDIEVLDLIKQDISKVQEKIIRDMSPSYRQNNLQKK